MALIFPNLITSEERQMIYGKIVVDKIGDNVMDMNIFGNFGI